MKKLIILFVLSTLCFSCTKEKRREIIKEEVTKSDSAIVATNNYSDGDSEYKYVINKRTGKVHSYSHGSSIVSDRYRLETNDDIEKILENENYDICLNCYAGLKLNLDKYKTSDKNSYNDEVDITNREVNLIKQYMNMYEFGKCDTETQKFLICIFEVGSWYVNNVYTQLGGQLSAREVDDIAEVEASESAYNKWRNYIDNYGKQYSFNESKRILPILFPDNPVTDMVAYYCDLFKDAGYGKGNSIYSKSGLQTFKNAEKEEINTGWKNYFVIDDSSKFAAAVYYHYINKEILTNESIENRIAYGVDLWETSSVNFLSENKLTDILVKTERFEIQALDENVDEDSYDEGNIGHKKFNLKAGDLICGNGNVEFYIGNNKYVGWGVVHKTYYLIKNYQQSNDDGYYYNFDFDGKNIAYTTIIRVRGGD